MKVFASLGARSIAFFIDALFVLVTWGGGAMLMGFPLPLWCFLPYIAIYFTALSASPWQGTLGKKALGIKITDLAGHRIGVVRAFLRFVVSFVTFATSGLGLVLAAWTPRRQALEDFAAGTLVVDANAAPEQIAARLAPPTSWGSRIAGVIGVAVLVFIVDQVYDMYRAFIIRDQMRDLFEGAGEFKSQVTDALNEHRTPPVAPSKLPPHARAHSASADGTIVLETADDLFPNGRLVFKPTMQEGRVASWDCRTEKIDTKYLPATCR